MKTLLTLLIVGVLIWFVLRAMRGASSGHPQFKALDVGSRPEASAEDFYNKFYADVGAHKESILRLLAHISQRTGIPAGKLDPADELGAIAAAGGFNRAMFVADLMNTFPEAETAISQKMLAGEFTLLHHAVALIANANQIKNSPTTPGA